MPDPPNTLLLNPAAADFWIEIGVAILCGAIVGAERQIHGKPVGIRTSILICFSTFIFVRLSGALAGAQGDPTRVLGQVVTGVGFLGGGVIFAQRGEVVGVTTAAVIWVLAAIGSSIGLRQYPAALVLAVMTVGILLGVEFLERHIPWLRRGEHRRAGERPAEADEPSGPPRP